MLNTDTDTLKYSKENAKYKCDAIDATANAAATTAAATASLVPTDLPTAIVIYHYIMWLD